MANVIGIAGRHVTIVDGWRHGTARDRARTDRLRMEFIDRLGHTGWMDMTRISRVTARLANIYRSGGATALARLVLGRLSPAGRAYRQAKARQDRSFDAAGYDTGGIQRIYGMDIVGDNAASGGNHIAVPPDDFRATIAALDIPIDGATFVDLGSGKGRAVMLAADYPFARIIGVEFARELHEVAVANLARMAKARRGDTRFELLCEDATRFAYPDGPLIVFLFNSFAPPVLTAVAEAALADWRRSPRPMRVIYLNPVHLADWIAAGWREMMIRDGYAILAPPER